MKCDDCIYHCGYILSADECGAGNATEYCGKGHWDGAGPDSAEEYERQKNMPDPWINCNDYRNKLTI